MFLWTSDTDWSSEVNLVLFLNVTADLNHRVMWVYGKSLWYLRTRWWHKVEIPYSFEFYFSRELCEWWVIFLRIFLVSGISVWVGSSELFLGIFFCAVDVIYGRWGDLKLRRILFWILGIITEIRFGCTWSNRWSSIWWSNRWGSIWGEWFISAGPM